MSFVSSTVGLSMHIVSSYYLMPAVPNSMACMQCLCYEARVVFSIWVGLRLEGSSVNLHRVKRRQLCSQVQ